MEDLFDLVSLWSEPIDWGRTIMGGLADDRCLVLCAADGSGRKVYLIYVVSIFVATAVRLSRDLWAVSSSSRSSMPSAAGDEALTKAVRAATLALTLVYTFPVTPHFRLKSPRAIGMVVLALGAISVFLGAGGGPLNVACMVCLFSFLVREASVKRASTERSWRLSPCSRSPAVS
jgi:hypothetical protein